ncbi:MAG: VTT domain-containing protein [Nanoarchaeota archaeon]
MVDIVNATVSATTQFVTWSQTMVETTGYLGVFLVSLIGSASIFFPVPAFIVIFAAGVFLNPWLVGLIAGIGSAIGELTGYLLGFGGRKVAETKYEKQLEKTKKWVDRRGAFFVIFLFALTPLPDDIAGIIAGVIEYDIKKFFIATLIGKIILSVGIALAGFYGMNWILGLIAF